MKIIESDLAEEGLIVPYERAGSVVIIRGVGDFCSGKEL